MTPRVWGDDRMDVAIRAGGITKVTARLSAPAWIDLEVKGSVSMADREAICEQHDESDPMDESVTYRATRAHVRLWPPMGYPLEVEFARDAYMSTSAAGTHLFSSLELGTRAKSEALAPGSYRLEIKLAGGRLESRDVLLVAGEVLTLSVDLGGALSTDLDGE